MTIDTAEVRVTYLEGWFQYLKLNCGLNPCFVHMDKDSSEIAATQLAWPHAKISLCLWHLDRAIRMRLKKLSQFPDVTRYNTLCRLFHSEHIKLIDTLQVKTFWVLRDTTTNFLLHSLPSKTYL